MRVATVTSAFHSSFAEFFPDLEIIKSIPRTTSEYKKYDLVIFTGGEDINPGMYGERCKFSSFNEDRDTIERNVFDYYFNETKCKILGVCRGHQLISVLLGGRLYQDLHFEGLHHPGYHNFDHQMETEFIPRKVNSMHHQGVCRFGVNYARILATYRGVAEAVAYSPSSTSRIITTQWHPEFMGDANFFDWIKKWSENKIEVDLSDSISVNSFHYYADTERAKANPTRNEESNSPPRLNTYARSPFRVVQVDPEEEPEEEENENEEDDENNEEEDETSYESLIPNTPVVNYSDLIPNDIAWEPNQQASPAPSTGFNYSTITYDDLANMRMTTSASVDPETVARQGTPENSFSRVAREWDEIVARRAEERRRIDEARNSTNSA
jgi:putative glutamine amidotransferase